MSSAAGSATQPRPATDTAHQAVERAAQYLLSVQSDDGHWCAELEGDSILQSEYILLKWILGQEDDPRLPRIAAYLHRQQQPDGSWIQYPGGKTDISATVKGYFVLKLMGHDPNADHMKKARERVLELGGAERCNSFTKFYLAALGQIRYSAQPLVPPEIVFLPRWSYFHLDKLSAWTRTMVLPLAIVTTHRPRRDLTSDKSIVELYREPDRRHRPIATQDRPHPFWSRFFLAGDRVLKLIEPAIRRTTLRQRAVKWVEQWMLRHLEGSDGLGAIFPPMVYIQIALRCLGYPDDHPVLVKARKDLDDLMIEDANTSEIRIQPCVSPVWDTGIAAFALSETGRDAGDPAMSRCVQWLLSKECREPGDWEANVARFVEPSGWFFEYNNPFYPDVDDTAMVSMALRRIGGQGSQDASHRGIEWILAMQNDDGGWAAFDRDAQGRDVLEQVPFADHNAIQDPSCPDITGRVLESLGWHGYGLEHAKVRAAVRYLQRTQHADGGWFGRWGVNYIYGSFEVLCGLEKVGCDMSADWIAKAARWLKSVQRDDGSFGESPDTYEDASTRGQGPPTASQSAWGAMGLMAACGPGDEAVQRAIAWLIEQQTETGTWDEPWFTGTGFPRVFYLRYHLYRHYFPLMAIARWHRLRA